MLLGSK